LREAQFRRRPPDFGPREPNIGKTGPKPDHPDAHRHLPSPSRHIYNSLTIVVAFRRLGAFDRLWQYPVKVDGTFA
jgi:hypothetical protein